MRQQGRTSPRTPYSTEYRNRKGFSETIQDHAERLKNVELRATRTPLPGESVVEVRLNGVPVGAHNILDLIEGANVTLTVSDDGQVIRIEIAASGTSSSGYDTIEDEGTPLAQETVLDFQGAGVTATPGVGKTVVTIPGGSSSGGGVFAADAVVAPGYAGADGDTTTLATGEVVFIYKTAQAAHDAWVNGDWGIVIGNPCAVIRLNRNSAGGGPLVCSDNMNTPLYLAGEAPGGPIDGINNTVNDLGDVTIQSTDMGVIFTNLVIGILLTGAGVAFPPANDFGMRVKLEHCAIGNIHGAFADNAGGQNKLVAMNDVYVNTDWLVDPTHQATGNEYAKFVNSSFYSFSDAVDGTDAVIAGVYAFVTCSFNGFISFAVATDKHFAFVANSHVRFNMEFQMDGGTLTLDLDDFHLHDGARIVITDLGGGGTVILNWSGGSVEQTAAPVIEADATIVVTGSVDGVALLGTPNSPAFKGQFVDFAFGDAISPPSYVVEFL